MSKERNENFISRGTESGIGISIDERDTDLDDFILDNLLDDEISEFKKLMRLKQILETIPQRSGYFI